MSSPPDSLFFPTRTPLRESLPTYFRGAMQAACCGQNLPLLIVLPFPL